jgi:hypothetical protein
MIDKPSSQFAQLQELARRLQELDVNDPDLASKVIALKGRATRAMNTPVGNPDIKSARGKAIANRQAAAEEFKRKVRPHIEAAKASGRTSLSEIAKYLNDNNVASPAGSRWLPATVARAMQ